MSNWRWTTVGRLGLMAAAVLASTSCGTVVRQGQGSAYLVIDKLEASRGFTTPLPPNTFLQSDVITFVTQTINGAQVRVPTIFEDAGQVSLHLNMKDVTVTAPSSNSQITISRYHVKFTRTDGRNVQGVDLPYEFDGALTATVSPGATATVTFVLVRAQSKIEPPLLALRDGGGQNVISTIAEVTFYGKDQTGNDVSVSGTISVNFADWGDPS